MRQPSGAKVRIRVQNWIPYSVIGLSILGTAFAESLWRRGVFTYSIIEFADMIDARGSPYHVRDKHPPTFREATETYLGVGSGHGAPAD